MSNKEIIKTFFDEITNGNIEKAFLLVSDDVNWWIPGALPFSGNKTKEQYMQIVNAINSGFPTGFKIAVTSSIAEENIVAAEAESFSVHRNGKTYNNRYHFLFEIENEKIISVKEYMDTLHLFQLIQP